MSVAARLTAFAALLLAVFAAAALAGGLTNDEDAPSAAGERVVRGAEHDARDDGAHAADGDAAAHGTAAPAPGAALPGLAVAQDGYRLEVTRAPAGRSGRAPLAFRILDADGAPVRRFDVEHTKRMHLIVVRRDLRGFQHLHPTMAPDGTWTAELDVARAGTYRAFADFSVAGTKRTLGVDLHVAGAFAPEPLPPAADVARAGTGLEVRLRRDGGAVAFDVLRDGRVVNGELEEYLGAKGHLVTLRVGDLAYLHTHPDGDRLAFDVALPSSGAYRMWVQFQLAGVVHTAAFTQEVGA